MASRGWRRRRRPSGVESAAAPLAPSGPGDEGPTPSPRAPTSTRGVRYRFEGAVKCIFRAGADSRTRSRSSPCPHRKGGVGRLYPWLNMSCCALLWGAGSELDALAGGLCWLICAVLVRVYAGNPRTNAVARSTRAVGTA